MRSAWYGRVCVGPELTAPLVARSQRPAELVVDIKPEVEDGIAIDHAFADVFAKFRIPQEDEVSPTPPRLRLEASGG